MHSLVQYIIDELKDDAKFPTLKCFPQHLLTHILGWLLESRDL